MPLNVTIFITWDDIFKLNTHLYVSITLKPGGSEQCSAVNCSLYLFIKLFCIVKAVKNESS